MHLSKTKILFPLFINFFRSIYFFIKLRFIGEKFKLIKNIHIYIE